MKIPGTNAGLPRMTLRGSGSISRLRLRFADRRPKIPGPGPSDFKLRASYIQNSNRECIRLETAVTQRKQRIGVSSNREKEACFFGPSRGGVFMPSPTTATSKSKTPAGCLRYAGENRKRLPPKVLRLKRRPIVCFVGVAGDFNRTMSRLEILAGLG